LSEQTDKFLSGRVFECVTRAFYSIGTGLATQDIIFWNLAVSKHVGRADIVDKPTEFVEGLRDIYGEAWVVVFGYKLVREIKQEFGLTGPTDEGTQDKRIFDFLRRIEDARRDPLDR
jgi:hypothetical protein